MEMPGPCPSDACLHNLEEFPITPGPRLAREACQEKEHLLTCEGALGANGRT